MNHEVALVPSLHGALAPWRCSLAQRVEADQDRSQCGFSFMNSPLVRLTFSLKFLPQLVCFSLHTTGQVLVVPHGGLMCLIASLQRTKIGTLLAPLELVSFSSELLS